MTTPSYLDSLDAIATLGLPLTEVRAEYTLPPEIASAILDLEVGLLKIKVAIIKARLAGFGLPTASISPPTASP